MNETNKLKILIINHNPKERGTYFRCYGFAKSLAKLGHEVFFICRNRNEQKPKLQITKYKENGVNFIELPLFNSLGFFGLIEHFFRGLYIFSFYAFKKFDIVHSFNVASPMTAMSTFLIYLIKKVKKTKIIVDWDDWFGKGGLTALNHQGKLQESVADFFETKIPLLADAVTLHSEEFMKRATGCGVKKEKITKIYNGADPGAYDFIHKNKYSQQDARQELKIDETKTALFFGSGVVASVGFLLEVLKKIENKNIIMIIVGTPDANAVNLAKQLSVDNRVFFKGIVSYVDFKKYLVASDILLLPRSAKSLLDRCTFPGRVGDYIMSGRPIVASDVGELSVIFRKDKLGLLAESDNVEDFKNKIMALIDDKPLREKLSANALNAGMTKYNWDTLTKILLEKVYYKKQ